MAQDKIKISIKKFEEMLEKKHKREFKTGQIYKVENSVIGRLGGGSMRQKTWDYFLHGNKSGKVASYYRDDRYGITY
jgi:hypothetical protein